MDVLTMSGTVGEMVKAARASMAVAGELVQEAELLINSAAHQMAELVYEEVARPFLREHGLYLGANLQQWYIIGLYDGSCYSSLGEMDWPSVHDMPYNGARRVTRFLMTNVVLWGRAMPLGNMVAKLDSAACPACGKETAVFAASFAKTGMTWRCPSCKTAVDVNFMEARS